MEAILRSVHGGPAQEADAGETAPSFEEFYEATFRRLFTGLCLVTGNRHEAEEVAQESFVRVFERWDHVGVLEDPTGYLFRVSMNVFRSRYRRASLGLRRAFFLAPAATGDLAAVETHDAVGPPAPRAGPHAAGGRPAHSDPGLLGRGGGPDARPSCLFGSLPHHTRPRPDEARGDLK
jgi:DNA-directed RNA polymerase specialized sigma24 family protein